ncbi:MAG: hypothetical protein ACYDEA_05040 [Candidatus Dormibacteria bacterium]
MPGSTLEALAEVAATGEAGRCAPRSGRPAWLREWIGDDLIGAVVVTTGQFAYLRPDGIAVVPAALLGA